MKTNEMESNHVESDEINGNQVKSNANMLNHCKLFESIFNYVVYGKLL